MSYFLFFSVFFLFVEILILYVVVVTKLLVICMCTKYKCASHCIIEPHIS